MSADIIKMGDIVTVGYGKVHWEVMSYSPRLVVLKSGMSERRRFVNDPSTLRIFKTREQVAA